MWEGDYTARVNEKGKAFQFGNFVGKKYETSCINDKVYKQISAVLLYLDYNYNWRRFIVGII